MKPSGAFLHPWRTARRMAEAEHELRQLRETAAADHEALVAARARVTECETDVARFEATVTSLLDSMAALRTELDTRTDSYERRIATLNATLRRERESHRAPAVNLSKPEPPAPEPDLPSADDDWLLPLT